MISLLSVPPSKRQRSCGFAKPMGVPTAIEPRHARCGLASRCDGCPQRALVSRRRAHDHCRYPSGTRRLVPVQTLLPLPRASLSLSSQDVAPTAPARKQRAPSQNGAPAAKARGIRPAPARRHGALRPRVVPGAFMRVADHRPFPSHLSLVHGTTPAPTFAPSLSLRHSTLARARSASARNGGLATIASQRSPAAMHQGHTRRALALGAMRCAPCVPWSLGQP